MPDHPDTRAGLLSVRVTAAQREELEAAARDEGVRLSEFVRRVLLTAGREVGHQDPPHRGTVAAPAAPDLTPLEHLRSELRRVGTNLNTLLRDGHLASKGYQGRTPLESEYLRLQRDLDEVIELTGTTLAELRRRAP